MKALTLLELNGLVRQVIEQVLPQEYWVEAELSECRESRGHCYMELVQKDEYNATPIARAQAKCWRTQWLLLQPMFERTTGQVLHAGMKLRLKVYAQFHEAYGFSWIVTDIDPTFTLGDMARKRQEIIRRLKAEGVFDLQKELHLPLFCQRIAVISSETAAGYGDFCKQLADNPYGLKFHTQLFPAIMQGEQVEQSIISALNDVYSAQGTSHKAMFDCVVIIRGGGATADMSGFDTLALAENVAQFPLPIITGIGHDRDECVLDMVSFLRVKTPTAAAQHLIAHAEEILHGLEQAGSDIARYARNKIANSKLQIANMAETIPRLFTIVKSRQEAQVIQLQQRMANAMMRRIEREHTQVKTFSMQLSSLSERLLTQRKHDLSLLSERMKLLDPSLLLRRGYSITMVDGKALRNPHAVAPGDIIETRLEKGIIKSSVI